MRFAPSGLRLLLRQAAGDQAGAVADWTAVVTWPWAKAGAQAADELLPATTMLRHEFGKVHYASLSED
ncbi:MAG: hypothetical protein U1E42_13965 [Rhodospirillales bacterium]